MQLRREVRPSKDPDPQCVHHDAMPEWAILVTFLLMFALGCGIGVVLGIDIGYDQAYDQGYRK